MHGSSRILERSCWSTRIAWCAGCGSSAPAQATGRFARLLGTRTASFPSLRVPRSNDDHRSTRNRDTRSTQGLPPPPAHRRPLRAQAQRPRAEGRHVHGPPRRMRRDPRAQRVGQVDARPPALDAALARRRLRAHLRPRRVHGDADRAAARQPRLGRGELLQAHERRGEPRLRRALLRPDARRHEGPDPGDPDARRLPRRATRRADGEPLARDAAEGRPRAGAPHVAGETVASHCIHCGSTEIG
jgi:hypothetical protein